MTRIGDRQRYPLPNQRFGKATAAQLAELYETLISRFVGSIVGQAWGCITAPNLSAQYIAGPPTEVRINVGECLFVQSITASGVNTRDVDRGPYITKIILHDPLRSTQTSSSIDVTAYAPTALGGGGGTNGQPCWLVFRRQEAPGNFDNEVFWDTTSDAENIGADNLLTMEWVEFAAVATIPSAASAYGEENGWFRFAYIPFWDLVNGPTLMPIHWIHSTFFRGPTPPTIAGGQSALAAGTSESWDGGGNSGFSPLLGMPSVGKLLHWLTMKVGQHVDPQNVRELGRDLPEPVAGLTTGAVVQSGLNPNGWLTVPNRGLVQLDTDLTAAEAALVQATNDIITVDVRTRNTFRPIITIRARKITTNSYQYAAWESAVDPSVTGLTWTVTGDVLSGILNHSFTFGISTGTEIWGIHLDYCSPTSYVYTGTDVPIAPMVVPNGIGPWGGPSTAIFNVRWVTPGGTGVEPEQFFLTVMGRNT